MRHAIIYPMNIRLEVNPLSVNKAWRGRHFKTKDYDLFEREVCIKLPFSINEPFDGEVFVHYVYHIKNYGNADTANMEKTLTDMLVKRKYLKDDRYIRAIYQRKERVSKSEEEFIVIHILPYTGQDVGGIL